MELSAVLFNLAVLVELAGGLSGGEKSCKSNVRVSPVYYKHVVHDIAGLAFVGHREEAADEIVAPLAPVATIQLNLERLSYEFDGGAILLNVVGAEVCIHVRTELAIYAHGHGLLAVHVVNQEAVAVGVQTLVEESGDGGGVDAVLCQIDDAVLGVIHNRVSVFVVRVLVG